MINPEVTMFGYDVYITDDKPKIQLSNDCPVTPQFRKEMNQWMLEFFGHSREIVVLHKNRCIFTPKSVYMDFVRMNRTYVL